MICNLCDQEIKEGLVAPCGTPHHKECWDEYLKDLESVLLDKEICVSYN